ncbi:hypothetical protein NMY22_g19648 [Coprinellus aureogranulatus]|nr:hypothetical protein NMY22_g19648 [Coprinellus aureogranulatus]
MAPVYTKEPHTGGSATMPARPGIGPRPTSQLDTTPYQHGIRLRLQGERGVYGPSPPSHCPLPRQPCMVSRSLPQPAAVYMAPCHPSHRSIPGCICMVYGFLDMEVSMYMAPPYASVPIETPLTTPKSATAPYSLPTWPDANASGMSNIAPEALKLDTWLANIIGDSS